MELLDLPCEILTLISDFSGIYNFNLAKTCTLFQDITKKVSEEEFRDGLYREGDLVTIERYNLPFTGKNIEDSATYGHLPILIHAKSKGYRYTERTSSYAAGGGHLEVLKWLREPQFEQSSNSRQSLEPCPWSVWTCAYAAGGGHLEVLKWLRQNDCPWSEWTCAYAAGGGHLEVLKWLRQNDCPWDERTCAQAAQEGHLEILKWLRENGCPWGK